MMCWNVLLLVHNPSFHHKYFGWFKSHFNQFTVQKEKKNNCSRHLVYMKWKENKQIYFVWDKVYYNWANKPSPSQCYFFFHIRKMWLELMISSFFLAFYFILSIQLIYFSILFILHLVSILCFALFWI